MNDISFQGFLQLLKEKPPADVDFPDSAEEGRETLDLVKHYYEIADAQERRMLVELVKAMAQRYRP